MFKCPECQNYFATILVIKNHLKYVHAYGHLSFRTMFCPSDSCSTELNTWGGLSRHLKQFHDCSNSSHENSTKHGQDQFTVEVGDNLEESNLETHNLESSNLESVNLEAPNFEINENEIISIELGVQLFTDLLQNFCSSLLANRVNNSTVDFIVKEMSYCFSEVFNLVFRMLRNFDIQDFEIISSQVRGLLAAFSKVKSSYKRQKLSVKNDNVILPI